MSGNKECELPAADSCALAEGEEPEDDLVYTKKPSLLGKLRAIANKVGLGELCFLRQVGQACTRSLKVIRILETRAINQEDF